jgi:hypothetical protein
MPPAVHNLLLGEGIHKLDYSDLRASAHLGQVDGTIAGLTPRLAARASVCVRVGCSSVGQTKTYRGIRIREVKDDPQKDSGAPSHRKSFRWVSRKYKHRRPQPTISARYLILSSQRQQKFLPCREKKRQFGFLIRSPACSNKSRVIAVECVLTETR